MDLCFIPATDDEIQTVLENRDNKKTKLQGKYYKTFMWFATPSLEILQRIGWHYE